MATTTLFQDVYGQLLQRLLNCELRPGDVLNRRQVAAELGVSVAPVREAFQRLEFEGFLISRPRVGTMVRTIEVEDVRGRLLLREAIEAQAARLYCGAAVRRNRRRLDMLAECVHAEHHSTAEQWQAEIDFHRALVELVGNDVLLKAFDDVMQKGLFYAVNCIFPPQLPSEDMNTYHRNHFLLVEALTTDDPQFGAQVAYEHVHRRLSNASADATSPFYLPGVEAADLADAV